MSFSKFIDHKSIGIPSHLNRSPKWLRWQISIKGYLPKELIISCALSASTGREEGRDCDIEDYALKLVR